MKTRNRVQRGDSANTAIKQGQNASGKLRSAPARADRETLKNITQDRLNELPRTDVQRLIHEDLLAHNSTASILVTIHLPFDGETPDSMLARFICAALTEHGESIRAEMRKRQGANTDDGKVLQLAMALDMARQITYFLKRVQDDDGESHPSWEVSHESLIVHHVLWGKQVFPVTSLIVELVCAVLNAQAEINAVIAGMKNPARALSLAQALVLCEILGYREGIDTAIEKLERPEMGETAWQLQAKCLRFRVVDPFGMAEGGAR